MCNYHQAAHRGHFSGRSGRFPGFSSFFAPINIVRKDDLFELELHLPGKSREDFQVDVRGSELTIAYKGVPAGASESGQWIRREFNPGSFERVFQLDQSVDTELITARYDNGILIVLLPIKPEFRRPSQRVTVA